MIAILRRCARCAEWRSIDEYVPLGKVCQPCMREGAANNRIARNRAIVITPQGRATIRDTAA